MAARDLVPITATPSPLAARRKKLTDAWLETTSPETVDAYTRDLGHFARFLGVPYPNAPRTADDDARAAAEEKRTAARDAAAEYLISLTHAEANERVAEYRTHMKQRKLSPATSNRRIASLRSMVDFAKLHGLVSWSINVKGYHVEAHRDTRGPEQAGYMAMWKAVRAVADQADDPIDSKRAKRDLAMMMLMRDLLLRRGSCASLELADVNIDDSPATISVITKGKAQKRRMELPDPVRAVLAEWLEARGDQPGPVFIRLDPGAHTAVGEMQPLDGESINRAVRRAGQRAGLKRRARAHGLRHQGITRLLEKNDGNVPETMALSGHAKPETVMKYNDNRLNAAGKGSRSLADDYA